MIRFSDVGAHANAPWCVLKRLPSLNIHYRATKGKVMNSSWNRHKEVTPRHKRSYYLSPLSSFFADSYRNALLMKSSVFPLGHVYEVEQERCTGKLHTPANRDQV